MTHERFSFDGGGPMNPYWVWKTMTDEEKHICFRLVDAGPLGWNKKSLNAAHISSGQLESLIQYGLINGLTRLQRSAEFLNNERVRERASALETEGWFLGATNSVDRRFIMHFDSAGEIVAMGEVPENQEIYYQVANPSLFDFIGLLG